MDVTKTLKKIDELEAMKKIINDEASKKLKDIDNKIKKESEKIDKVYTSKSEGVYEYKNHVVTIDVDTKQDTVKYLNEFKAYVEKAKDDWKKVQKRILKKYKIYEKKTVKITRINEKKPFTKFVFVGKEIK